MFEEIMANLYKNVGKIIERNGKSYLKLDEKSWLKDNLYVTAEIVVPSEAFPAQIGFDQIVEADLKVLINVKPR